MQKRQGYCSYCRVQYHNLEQHLFSAQHRSLTRQSRRQICTSSLMERFLQDVLQHHPYHCQESSSTRDETHVNTGSSSEVVHLDDDFSEEEEEDEDKIEDEDATEERPSEASEPIEELHSRPHKSQEGTQEVSVRPSVIQKLEKGQQQPLEFVHKIGAGVKKCNLVDIGQATNNGSNLVRPPVIYNAPASCLSESSNDRPVTTNTTGLPAAAHLDSVSKYDPNKVDKYLEQPDGASRNPVPSSHVETSSFSHQKPKESNRKYLRMNSDKLVLWRDVKSQGKTLSAGLKFQERMGTKDSLRVKSPSKLAVNPNKTDMPLNKGIFEDTIPKHHEEFFSNMDCTQEEKHLVFNKKAFWEQKCSVSSEMKFDCSSLQSASDQPQETAQDINLWKEERIDQEDNYESRGSEMSFDCSSSFHSLTDQSKVSAKEVNLSKEACTDVQYKNNTSYVSKRSSDCGDILHLVTNQSQMTVKEISLQNARRISLVDQSYESSDSETNFDCDASPQSTSDYPHQSVKEVSLSKEVHIGLVDKNYGSSSSEVSADSVFPLQSVVERPPVVVRETKLRKKAHSGLVDNYGSSCSETSFDCDVSLESVVDHPQLTVKGRNLKGRQVHLKHKKRKPSSAKARFDCDVSLGTVADESQRAVEKINLLKEKNADLMDVNYESHGLVMGFHTGAQLVADQPQVAEIEPQKVDVDLENKSVQSSSSSLSSDSPASLYHSAHDEPQEALDEVNLKELNIDMEVKSYDCSSSELTFDSDPPLLSVSEQSHLDAEGKERHIDLEDESCESDSSEITFDSDIPLYSVIDQPEVAVYEEETVDLESKSNESCVSEITFDSDIPLHSGNDHPEVAVKEVIQKEEYIHLERKNDEPSGSEISLDSYAPRHSVTNSPEVAVKKLNPQKEDQVHLENKENEPIDSEVSLDYNTIFHSVTGHSEDPIKKINLHTKEHMYLENKSGFETSLDSDVPLRPATHKPQVIVKETWLQREKHAEFQGGSAEFSGSKTSLDSSVPHYSVTESQVAVNKINRKKQYVLENYDKCSGSEIILDSNVPPQSMTDQTQLAFLKEKHVNLRDKNSKSGDSEITFDSEQLQEAVKKIDQWKEEVIGLKNKINEPSTSKLIHDSDVSVQSVADQPKVAIKHVNLENENHMYLEVKNSQYRCSEMNLDSRFLVQSIVNRPQITILERDHIELEGKHNQRCGSEISFDSDDPLQSVADQLRETVKEISLWKDEEVDMEDSRNEAKGFEIMYDSAVLQPVAGQPEGVVKEVSLWKEHVDLENKIVKPTNTKINFDSHDPLLSVTNKIQGVNKERNLLREERVCLDDKGYVPSDSGIIYVSNIPPQSVIKQPQILQEEHASLEDKSSISYSPEESSDSSDSFQAAADELQKSAKEINLWKEDHIYLEDKSYKLGDFDVSYASHIPVQFVTDQSSVPVKEINVQKKNHNNLASKNCEVCGSKIKCDSCGRLQSEVDQPQVSYKEADLQKEEHVVMEEKTGGPSDSEMMYDSDVPFQIVVNQFPGSVKETHLPKVILLDLVPSDSDYEVISDDIPLQLVTDPPQLTVKDINCINTECIDIEDKSCDSFGSEVRCSCKASTPSMTNQCKETFKIINRKKDYIILGEPSCQSCGSEMSFNVDASDQSMTYESQGPDEKIAKYIDSEDKSCGYNGSKGKFNLGDTSHRTTHRLQKARKEAKLRKDPRHAGLKDIDDLSVALEKPCHRHPSAERPPKQKWRVASQRQTAKISHSTQTSCKNYPVMKRKIIRQEEDPPKSKCSRLQDDRKTKKKVKIGTVEFPASCTKVLKPMKPKALVCILSSLNIKLKEGEGLHFPKMRHHSWDSDIQFICKYKRNIFDYYEPLIKQIVINPPLNVLVPEFERRNWVKIHFNRSNQNSSAGDNDADGQGSASAPLMAVPARYGFNSRQGTSDPSLFLEESKILHAHEVPKKRNFQLTFLNRDVVRISPKSVRNKFLESKSKKKIHGKKVTTSSNKLGCPKKVYKPIILQQKPRKASEKQSIWIRTKPSDIIRKYISKYSVFLRHRYQSRRAFLGMYLKKKKSVVSRLKKVKRTAKVLLNSSVPPAGAEELSSATANPPAKRPVPVRASCHITRRKKRSDESYHGRKRSPAGPVRAYDLRSSSCLQQCGRRMTRLANKLRGNETK
ncbi:DBF4-type zinc finger-containing protein 2 isoform X3 [Macaca nemestrina]|uniref:DBF4-type zinc finger-containing protein 2 isoform X3 n=1 Tax=Macaca nemestrina TaxID=9545 RepID=UPI0039B91468